MIYQICQRWCKLLKAEHDQVKKLSETSDKYHKRVVELEDAMEKEYGVKIRQEITQVNILFTKMELSILYAALCRLMTQQLNTEDMKFYLDLRVKIEDIMEQIKE